MNTSRDIRPIVEAMDVEKRYGNHKVLRGISIKIFPGEVVAIIGPSGSGKTTFLRSINHLELIDGGKILVDGELIGYREVKGRLIEDKESRIASRREKIGMVFQRFNLFPHLSALENIIEAPIHVQKVTKADAIERAETLLARVGLTDKRNHYPAMLSGGQQQRVAIARALAMKPKLMLFDEPTSALDPELVGEVLAVMSQLANEGMTMIVVSHELQFVQQVADRVIFMEDGKIVEQGSAKQVFSEPCHERTKVFLRKFLSSP